MVVNINAKIDLGAMPKDGAKMMSALNASLPELLDYVAESKRWTTVVGNLADGEGKDVGVLTITLSNR